MADIPMDVDFQVLGNIDVLFDPRSFYLSDFEVLDNCLLDISIDSDGKFLDTECQFQWPEERYPYYEGSYIIEPRKVPQIMETEKKSLQQDMEVKAIYCSRVDNPTGGITVLIGKE